MFKLFTGSGIYSYVQRTLAALIAGLIWFSGFTADGAHTRASLHFDAATAKPGETITAGVHLQMDPGWHIYWKNAGEGGLGQPAKITWQLPPGVTAGEILWPVPEKLPVPKATTYIFHGDVALLVPLKLATDLKPGPLEISAKLVWLECEKACVQSRASVTNKLEIAAQTQPSPDATLFATWRGKLPKTDPNFAVTAAWDGPATGDARPLILEWPAPSKLDHADFFPDEAATFEVGADTETLTDAPGKVRLRKLVQKSEGDWPKEISGLAIMESSGQTEAFEVKATAGTASANGSGPKPVVGATQSLGLMLLYAFLGGLILNVMPCVFPVIALKIFGFVQQSQDEPRRVFALGLIYGLGVLASFVVMAGLVIAIQQAGGSASWGMQFKSPQLSVGFIALVVLIALNLFGVFEINLGGGAMGVAGQLASKHGAGGAFFNGVLATVLATPCTAPVLASALGFAFAQPPLVVLLFFLTIGCGLAFPYVLLSWKPGWLKFLPRPGAWMEKFKVAMGFPMLATAVWIFWFTAPRFGDDGVIWIGLFLVGLAFAVWIWGGFVQRGSKRRGLAMLIALGVIVASYAYALENKLHWRSPVKSSSAGKLQNDPDGVQWQPWSADAVAKARNEGRPVLVDFTAKWCLTCNKFVKPAVDNRDVRRKLDEVNGVALLADNTDYPDDVMAELKKFHSDAAVPLVLVYSRDASQPAMVLPTIPTRKDVVDALVKAAK